MRYSKESKHEVTRLPTGAKDHAAFFGKAMAASGANRGDLALLLVGGRDLRSIALRRAQAALRFDRRPSLWSHVALLCELDPKQPERSRGVEVTLDPIDTTLQCPERNGVTEFQLARYLDVARYANVAFVHARFPTEPAAGGRQRKRASAAQPSAGPRAQIVERLCAPLTDAQRYPLWNALATWARYVYTPELVPNPLLENVFMPSAALCEFGFEAALIDLTPGAAANNSCPELIWSTVTHWRDSLADKLTLTAFSVVGDEACTPTPVLSQTLALSGSRTPAD